jgi:hypothetical protein
MAPEKKKTFHKALGGLKKPGKPASEEKGSSSRIKI